MIAYALVGGKEKDGKRVPMSTEEIIQQYKELIPIIFTKAKADFRSKVADKLVGDKIKMVPYTQEVLVQKLLETYGNARTDDIGDVNHCIAGAVVREFNEDPSNPDLLIIFDKESRPPQKVLELLRATSCAPVYFEYPVVMRFKKYIDGGIGGELLSF